MKNKENCCVIEFRCIHHNNYDQECNCKHRETIDGLQGYKKCKFYRCRLCTSPEAIKEALGYTKS